MIYIGKYEELCPNRGYESLKNNMSDKAYEGQEKIIHYLQNGTKDMVSAKIPKDVFNGEPLGFEMIGMNDGTYTWWNTLAYYVEKYNLRLPKEFEKHILEQ